MLEESNSDNPNQKDESENTTGNDSSGGEPQASYYNNVRRNKSDVRMYLVGFLGLHFFLYAFIYTFAYSYIVFPVSRCTYGISSGSQEDGSVKSDSAISVDSTEFEPAKKTKTIVQEEAGSSGRKRLSPGNLGIRAFFAVYYGFMAFMYLSLCMRFCRVTDQRELKALLKRSLTWCHLLSILLLNILLVTSAWWWNMVPLGYILVWGLTVVSFLFLLVVTVVLVVKHFA